MTKRRALEIGLATGAALAFFARGSVVQAPALEVRRSVATSFAGQTLANVTLRGDLRNTDFTGATLRGVDLAAARLEGARFRGVTFDRACRWPEGFDPTLRGATLNDWPPP
jgi:uncharacterized protein YjbI with pentapeptide repeats